MTFPDPRVKARLDAIERVELDIDDDANTGLRQRYGDHAVPSFVLLDGDGDVVHRWVGGGDAERFLAELAQGEVLGADPARRAERATFARLLAALAAGDEAALARGSAELLHLHPEAPPDAAAVWWACCERAHERRDWPALAAAAARLLALPDGGHHEAVRVLADIATFERTGRTPQALQRHIESRIRVLAEPFPGSSLGDRVGALLGDRRRVSEAEADAWVDRANGAMDELTKIGAAAAPALLQTMRTRPEVALDCARVLGRMRLPATTATLRAELAAGLPQAWARAAFLTCLGDHLEAGNLPVLLEFVVAPQPGNVRIAAMEGLRDLLFQLGGSDRADVAAAVAAGFDSPSAPLRSWALQAAFYVHAPLPLDALDDLLDDARKVWSDTTVADNALWILLDQLGLGLVDGDGRPVEQRASADVLRAVRDWQRAHRGRLRWSADARRYLVVD